jgi:hypothetical protein
MPCARRCEPALVIRRAHFSLHDNRMNADTANAGLPGRKIIFYGAASPPSFSTGRYLPGALVPFLLLFVDGGPAVMFDDGEFVGSTM